MSPICWHLHQSTLGWFTSAANNEIDSVCPLGCCDVGLTSPHDCINCCCGCGDRLSDTTAPEISGAVMETVETETGTCEVVKRLDDQRLPWFLYAVQKWSMTGEVCWTWGRRMGRDRKIHNVQVHVTMGQDKKTSQITFNGSYFSQWCTEITDDAGLITPDSSCYLKSVFPSLNVCVFRETVWEGVSSKIKRGSRECLVLLLQ